MAVYNAIELAQRLHAAGWQNRDNRTRAVAICLAESGGNDQAKGFNFKKDAEGNFVLGADGNKILLSTDRGLMQINDFHQPQVSDECAFDPICNLLAAYKIFVGRSRTFSAWNTHINGQADRRMEVANVAVEAEMQIIALNNVIESLVRRLDVRNAAIEACNLVLGELNERYLASESAWVVVMDEARQRIFP